MTYITLNDLSNTIRKNLWKIPHDIDVVVGVPRSGMIPASIIAQYLNKPLVDVYQFVNGDYIGKGGDRFKKYIKDKVDRSGVKKVLIVDDCIGTLGYNHQEIDNLLSPLKEDFEIIQLVAYLESHNRIDLINIYLEDVSRYMHDSVNVVYYEWNLFTHNIQTAYFLFDMDGILCVDPPDDINTELYESYLPNATPNIIPVIKIGGIVTYRINKYREVTEEWLKKTRVQYGQLVMFNAESREQRNNSGVSGGQYKAYVYNNSNAICFVESNQWEAEQIYQLTNKPVYCLANNVLYGNEYQPQ